MDKFLSLLGITRKAGGLELGEESAGAAVRWGKAKVLMLASDASDNARRRAEGFVYGSNTPLIVIPYEKTEISSATGKTGCSMAAVTDIGLAKSLAAALHDIHGAEYAEIRQLMEQKEKKARQRQKEAAAHDRNKRLGKKSGNRRTNI